MVSRPNSLIALAIGTMVFLAGCAKQPESTTTTENSSPSTSSETPKTDAPKTDAGSTTAVDFEKSVKPVLVEYCAQCHSGPTPKKGLDVTKLTGTEKPNFNHMASEVEEGKMPPPNAKQLPADVKTKLSADLKALGA